MIVKVVIPDSIYARVFFARGEQGSQGATGPQGVQGAQGPTGATGPAGTNGTDGTSYTSGDPIYVTVRNATGSLMTKGTIVYTSGGNGVHTQVSKALATGDSTSARTLGWLSEDIANNQSGLCMVEGYLEGINTAGVVEGSQLYLSPTVAGGFTSTKPVAPNHLVYVGVSAKASAGNGKVYVKVQNGYELDEIHDVLITTPANNEVLTYDTASGLWKNKVNPADGVTSITATTPLTGGTITSTGSIGLDQSLITLAQSQITNLVTDLAAKANLAGGNSITDAQTITATSASQVPLTLVASSGQTANLLATAGGACIPAGGNYFIAPGITASYAMDTTAGAIGVTPLTVSGISGQTADLQTWKVAGTTLALLTAGGTLRASGRLTAGSSTLQDGTLSVYSLSAGTIGAVIRGAASQSANLQEWQSSAGTVLASVTNVGHVRTTSLRFSANNGTIEDSNGISPYMVFTTGNIRVDARTATFVPMTLRGAASQTANLQEWQNSGGTVQASLSPFGVFTSGQNVINAVTSTVVPVLVKANASGTANLTEWQNSGGTVLARVNSAGIILGSSMRTLNSQFQATEENGGGATTMVRQTAAAGNPGANYGKLYFRDGTTTGTLKLVVRAGAAGAETTILDNIPQ